MGDREKDEERQREGEGTNLLNGVVKGHQPRQGTHSLQSPTEAKWQKRYSHERGITPHAPRNASPGLLGAVRTGERTEMESTKGSGAREYNTGSGNIDSRYVRRVAAAAKWW